MKKYYKLLIVIILISVSLTLMLPFVFDIIMARKTGYLDIILLVVGIIINIPSFMLYKEMRTSNTSKEIEKYYSDIRAYVIKDNDNYSNTKSDGNSSDILELMSINMREIKEYYVLSKTMAKDSFVLAVVMCILGFVIILMSIIAAFLKDITFIESLIPIIGGSIVEVIAGTTLVVYKKSLEQLNQYYEALHNNERYLSLVNLVDKLNNDKKNDVYISIINSQLEKLK